MAEQAKRDQNFVTSMLFVGSDGATYNLHGNEATGRIYTTSAGGSGTVTSVSVVTANGFAGTVATATTTPAITLTTTITGILSGNGTAISAASTTGSGSVVLATSPTLVTPALGTPTALVLTNATGLPLGGSGVTGTLAATNGGTGQNTYTKGDILASPGSNALNKLPVGTDGQMLVSDSASTNGVKWTTPAPAGSIVVGTTSITSGTTTRVLFDNAGVLGEYVISGSGNVAMTTSPSFTTPVLGTPTSGTLTNCTGFPTAQLAGLGTGVATALAINVGSAGAFVTFNGALGTPSSGTVTNLTGTASININGTVGATTPAAGTFTTATVTTGPVVVGHTASINYAGVAPNYQQNGTAAASGSQALAMYSATAGTQAEMIFYRSKNAAINNATVVASGDGLGKITWYGAQQTGTMATQSTAAQIRAEVDGTVTSGAGGDMPGRIIFSTTPDASGTLTDRLTLDSAGVLKPSSNDGVALGTTALMFSDLFLASGAVINFNNGNVTLTHSAGVLTLGGTATLALGTNSITMTGSLAATGARVTKGWFTDVESTNMITINGTSLSSATATFTNKRMQPRTASSTTAATLTPDVSSANVYYRTTQTATLTINAPTGTPVIGEVITIYVDSAGAQTLTIDATYKVFGVAFPATTTAGKTFMMQAQYNGTDWKTTWANAV